MREKDRRYRHRTYGRGLRAKKNVARGFEGMDAGHLDASRNIENFGLLVGQLAYGSGFGDRVSLRAYVASRAVRR
jgi:hypothetical protein